MAPAKKKKEEFVPNLVIPVPLKRVEGYKSIWRTKGGIVQEEKEKETRHTQRGARSEYHVEKKSGRSKNCTKKKKYLICDMLDDGQ